MEYELRNAQFTYHRYVAIVRARHFISTAVGRHVGNTMRHLRLGAPLARGHCLFYGPTKRSEKKKKKKTKKRKAIHSPYPASRFRLSSVLLHTM
jgi:hypothetical protein